LSKILNSSLNTHRKRNFRKDFALFLFVFVVFTYIYIMENTLKRVQTETMYEVEFSGETYSVTHSEDADPNSGCTSWEVYDDNGDFVDTKTEMEIIEFVIGNI